MVDIFDGLQKTLVKLILRSPFNELLHSLDCLQGILEVTQGILLLGLLISQRLLLNSFRDISLNNLCVFFRLIM
jgi:hypothetical protein